MKEGAVLRGSLFCLFYRSRFIFSVDDFYSYLSMPSTCPVFKPPIFPRFWTQDMNFKKKKKNTTALRDNDETKPSALNGVRRKYKTWRRRQMFTRN